ncbi:acetolactate synthase-1/2/3 large subunit [Arcicella aurantiaca]|uniref:Acetolactate synthase-1/2/3 large subunit n=1 Tax=Arcicella aurantiaca TaxID=591202 RepID=A0A316DVC3_9BACT|nr:thiamine pyrophosphate-binding protein [Arcicella aurantiaca]PWK21408.1 acetolactate synthase-1/2/3 large subunit [Arcicella aurantiaca]
MKASDYIAKFIELKGIGYVFELSGGMITHLLDSLNQVTSIKVVTMHHEQSASFAADAYGRVTGLPGVALATSGPGATNLLTGIASCYFDSSPAIFITGQVNLHEQKGNRSIRQLGFQETDIVSMAEPITKKCFRVENVNDIPQILNEAFRISTEGRPGPILIDIPMNIQRENIPLAEIIFDCEDKNLNYNLELSKLNELSVSISTSKKPLLLIGRGIKSSFSDDELKIFLQLTKIPVVTTLLAIDSLDSVNEQKIGFIGSYGNRWANIAFGECDLLIVLGSRLDIRQTGADTKFFEDRIIYHIDCEEGEINNRVKKCVPIVSDVKVFLNQFNQKFQREIFQKKSDWYNYIEDLRFKWPDTRELNTAGINPNVFMHQLSKASVATKAYLADVGAHQMWAAQSIEINNKQLFLTSGGMGAMGFALPASIGACLALNVSPVVTIIGDGCMQINIQELQTIVRNKLPIKIVVMNNQNLGMIRQFQDSYFESRYQSTWWGYSAPDFEKVAMAYGIPAKTVTNELEILEAVNWMWNEENLSLPVLLQVMIDPHTNTYPKIAFGKPITEMEPFSKPIAMEST